MSSYKIDVAIIGGTGFYSLDNFLELHEELDILTPWGRPSSPIVICKTKTGKFVAFVNRHGPNHEFTPTGVPYQANIAALKHLGVKTVLAFSSVGSLRQEIAPRDFVIPNQVIDRTKGIRPSSYFQDGLVGHAGFGEPFDPTLNKLLTKLSKNLLKNEGHLIHSPESLKRDVTLICMEGPAFSTRAESNMYRMFGGDVINMSCLPEAKLTREAEMSYQMICMSTDYDSWRVDENTVTVEHIIANLHSNLESAKVFITAVLDTVIAETESGRVGSAYYNTMQHSITTKPNHRDEELEKNIQFLFPNYK